MVSILPSPTQLLVSAITAQGKQNYFDPKDNVERATQRVKGVIYNLRFLIFSLVWPPTFPDLHSFTFGQVPTYCKGFQLSLITTIMCSVHLLLCTGEDKMTFSKRIKRKRIENSCFKIRKLVFFNLKSFSENYQRSEYVPTPHLHSFILCQPSTNLKLYFIRTGPLV